VTQEVLDNRGLAPPEPMQRTLAKLGELVPDTALVILNDREPVPLYAELERRGYAHAAEELPDGAWRVTIRRP
jgi:uncharacterized protein (DUF2249 family)